MTAKKKSVKKNNTPEQIIQAVKILKQGGVIAYPTEAVYGLGCDAENLEAVKKLLALKKREKEKGLILVVRNFERVKPYLLPLDKKIEEKILASWPGPVTWIIPAKDSVSKYLKGGFNSLAIRVSNHPVVKELCEKFGGIIVSSSANITQNESARTYKQVQQIFGDKIDFILEGETDINAQPSEIRDALTDKIIRK